MSTPADLSPRSGKPLHVEPVETKKEKHVQFAQGVKVMDGAEVARYHETKRASAARSRDTMESASGCCLDPVYGCVKSTYATVKPYIEGVIDFCTPYAKKVGEYFSWAFNSLWTLIFGEQAKEKEAGKQEDGKAASAPAVPAGLAAAKAQFRASIDEIQQRQSAVDAAPAQTAEGTEMQEIHPSQGATTIASNAQAAAAEHTVEELTAWKGEIDKFARKYAHGPRPTMKSLSADLEAMVHYGPIVRAKIDATYAKEIAAIKAEDPALANDQSITAECAARDKFLNKHPENLREITMLLEAEAAAAVTVAEHRQAMKNQAAIKKQFNAGTIPATTITPAPATASAGSVGEVVEEAGRATATASPAPSNGDYVKVEKPEPEPTV